jgi:hypothetical protein
VGLKSVSAETFSRALQKTFRPERPNVTHPAWRRILGRALVRQTGGHKQNESNVRGDIA